MSTLVVRFSSMSCGERCYQAEKFRSGEKINPRNCELSNSPSTVEAKLGINPIAYLIAYQSIEPI